MSDLVLGVDAEALAIQFLLAQPEIQALCGDRWYGALPATPDWPAGRVTLLDSSPVRANNRWLTAATLQLDVWGGPKATARRLIDTACAVLEARAVGVHDLGTVTAARTSSVSWQPDDSYENARPRYIAVATLTVHP